jgi:hypothetical protein
MNDKSKWPFPSPRKQEEAQLSATLVAISEDQREQELLTLFRSADERGKHCMIAMARCMPCMRGG